MASKAVIVWRCVKCGMQKEPVAMPPHRAKSPDDLPSWLWANGGMVHRCSLTPGGEMKLQGFDAVMPWYGYVECRMQVLLGEEAEEWASLQNNSSEDGLG